MPDAQASTVGQFLLRQFLAMTYSTQVHRHDLFEIHRMSGTLIGTMVPGTIVPIQRSMCYYALIVSPLLQFGGVVVFDIEPMACRRIERRTELGNMKMEETGTFGAKEEERTSRYKSISKPELEMLAVSAIRQHRALLASDQAVYEEWLRVTDEPSNSSAVLQALQEEYLARQKKAEAQQEELSEILDTLGFVPDVHFDDCNEESDETPILGNCHEVRN
ncbi:hypothetical protein N182_35960 [Sinorhizobium sp. GL2]|nr:hypothetical protein N182_35960 [Sinorhizobium sp. GL2]